MNQKSAIVIGAGIIGLATARALAVRNYKVTVIEKNGFASGASIRNFGMIWPIGQRQGKDFETARLSRAIWKEVLNDAGIWFDEVGSLHLAYKKDEWDVLEELADVFRDRGYQLLNGVDTMGKSPAVVDKGLMGSLYSRDEMIVDPRKTCAAISSWLNQKHKVSFYFDKPVTEIKFPAVWSNKEFWEADEIFICTGSEFDQLYGTAFNDVAPTRSKLQMMRIAAQPGQWRIGPALCGSLSLTHYKSFAQAGSLAALQKRLEAELPDYIRWGIHVMVSQMEGGELTIGDSHEYALSFDPFDKDFINKMILDYLKTFARFPVETVTETWHGVYTKLTNGDTHCVLKPEQGVTIINGFGGAGMTLSFGVCEQVIAANQ